MKRENNFQKSILSTINTNLNTNFGTSDVISDCFLAMKVKYIKKIETLKPLFLINIASTFYFHNF